MFVTLQPQSNTNPSDKYRVVDSSDWARYVNGATNTVAFAGQFDTLDEAIALRDKLNSVAEPNSTDYENGYQQAESAPIEMILAYPDADNDFQRGWNANIKYRKG
jgi:hypothetical protein